MYDVVPSVCLVCRGIPWYTVVPQVVPELRHTSRGDMELLLPWWFPLPDAVVKATFQAGIRYM